MSEQIAVRIPDDLAKALDQLVATERFSSKAEAIRTAIESFIEAAGRRRVGEAIAEGYRRKPQTDEEIRAARQAAIRSIAEESW
jgi:Arc/MetJ-type ribon-helix-helix transcriptional regulator